MSVIALPKEAHFSDGASQLPLGNCCPDFELSDGASGLSLGKCSGEMSGERDNELPAQDIVEQGSSLEISETSQNKKHKNATVDKPLEQPSNNT